MNERFWAGMCFLCAPLSVFACLGPLPKPVGRKTFLVNAEKSLKSESLDVVWSEGLTGVFHGSFLRCANRIQFYLDALTINITISLVTSHSLFFFSLPITDLSVLPFFVCYPVPVGGSPAALFVGFAGWVKLAVHRKWLLLQNSAIILKFSSLACLWFTTE